MYTLTLKIEHEDHYRPMEQVTMAPAPEPEEVDPETFLSNIKDDIGTLTSEQEKELLQWLGVVDHFGHVNVVDDA